jgi:hypothetical protein
MRVDRLWLEEWTKTSDRFDGAEIPSIGYVRGLIGISEALQYYKCID